MQIHLLGNNPIITISLISFFTLKYCLHYIKHKLRYNIDNLPCINYSCILNTFKNMQTSKVKWKKEKKNERLQI